MMALLAQVINLKGVFMSSNEVTDAVWFYEENGVRKGGASEAEIVTLINLGTISYGTGVWTKGMPSWQNIELTALKTHFADLIPPLQGEHINNTIVWFLAFAPLLGYMLEFFVAGIIHRNAQVAEAMAGSGKYWYITLLLNIGLSFWDENKLKKSGVNTGKFKGFVYLVPVYLYQRAKFLQHNLAYFIVWIVCFVLLLTTAFA